MSKHVKTTKIRCYECGKIISSYPHFEGKDDEGDDVIYCDRCFTENTLDLEQDRIDLEDWNERSSDEDFPEQKGFTPGNPDYENRIAGEPGE